MNPDAIEAAAKAIFNVRDGDFDLDEWDDLDSTERERYECDARAALEAAAPHLTREARAAELEAAAEALAPNPAMVGYESLGIDRAKIRLRRRAADIRAGQA